MNSLNCSTTSSAAPSSPSSSSARVAGLVEHGLLGEDRRAGAGGQGDGVGRPARHLVDAVAGVQLDLGEERAVPQVGDDDLSTLTPRSSSRFFIRSWVIGRGVATSSRAKAMAVASAPPMKIGSTRWSPVRLPQQHDRRAARAARPARRRAPSRPLGTLPPGLQPRPAGPAQRSARTAPSTCGRGPRPGASAVGAPEPVEVAVAPGVVEAVAEDELVGDLEADVVDLAAAGSAGPACRAGCATASDAGRRRRRARRAGSRG